MSETTLPPEGQAEDSQRNLTPPGALLTVGTIQGDGGVLLPPPPLRSERPLPRIDGYEVLEEVGQGGMGVVYKALHLRLKRVVALKMLQPAAGLSTSDWDHLLKRFRREAEALARVRHPNVVEVYDVGETPAGVPYFSLEFCSGGSLDRKLDGTPMPPREAAALIQALARGMAAAHKEQVIHRDLKPANVLLAVGNALRGVPEGSGTPRRAFPTDVVPKITDFGLARKLDEVGQTHSGAIFGTPSYMAPEQAQGKGRLAGPACDIYSLGAILYECLTGKPPFKAATVLDTLQQVISDEPVAPRQFNAKVPRDLETICLGCLHKEPARRYCDADTLADDLGRFLQGESILARPVGLAERTVRWVRKRPAVAGLLALLVLLTTTALGTITLLYRNAVEQADEARLERDEATRQRNRALVAEERERQRRSEAEANLARAAEAEKQARANLKLAREALDECFNVAKTDPVFQVPRMEKARQLLLRKTLRFYRNFRANKPDDPDLKSEEARQWFRVGEIESLLERTTQAREAYEKSRELYVALVKEHPDVLLYQQQLAFAQTNGSILLKALGRHTEAIKECQQAQAILVELIRANPAAADNQNALARAHINRGVLLADLGRSSQAIREYEQALAILGKLVQAHPSAAEYQRPLAGAHLNLGVLLVAQGKHAAALTEYEQALGLEEKLVKDHPDVLHYQRDLAITHLNRGVLLKELSKGLEARTEFESALGVFAVLVKSYPDVPEHQRRLASTHINLGNLFAVLGEGKKALQEYEEARNLEQRLMKAHPDLPEHVNRLALAHYNLGNLLKELGQRDKSLAEYDRARALQEKLVQSYPDVPKYQNRLASTHHNRGVLWKDLGKREEALKDYERARHLRRPLVEAHPEVPEYRTGLAHTHVCLGNLLKDRGQRDESLEEYGRARDLQEKLVHDHPDVPEYQKDLAATHTNLGALLAALGKLDESMKEHRLANELLRKLLDAHPEAPAYRNRLALTHIDLGNLLTTLGKYPEAIKEHGLARDLAGKLVKDSPDRPDYTAGIARAYLNRGALLAQSNRRREALVDLDEGIRQLDRLRQLDPHYPGAAHMLIFGLAHRASLLALLGRSKDADADWERAVRSAPVVQRSNLRLLRALSRARAGDYRRSAAEADTIALADSPSSALLYTLACIQALNAAAAHRDPARPLPQREKLGNEYARAAVALLKRAAAAGHFREPANIAHMDKDEDLAFLRDREDYKQFLAGLKPEKLNGSSRKGGR